MAEIPNFAEGSYRLGDGNVECERTVNFEPYVIEKGPRKGRIGLRNIPGLEVFGRVGTGPTRGLWSNVAAAYVASGGGIWQVFNDGTPNLFIGPIDNDTHPVIITSNGFQLAFASAGKAFIAPGGGFGVIPIVDITGQPVLASSIAFMNEYFLASIKDTNQFMISNLAPDGGTWDPANIASKEAYSDKIVRLWVDDPGGQYLWLFGNDTLEIWIATGDLFPFQRMQSGVFSIGCDSAYSVAGVAGWRGWLWHGVIWGCQGFAPARISDSGVEQAIASYSTQDQENCEAFAWVHGQHAFYAISFGNHHTWVYDVNLQQWHERLFYFNGQYSRYRPRVYTKAFGKNLVGDYGNNFIYSMEPTVYTDANCVPLRRQRICPYIVDQMNNDRYNRLTLDMDTGVGLSVPAGQPGSDPQVLMRYSKNRGKRWSNERQQTFGPIGDDERRVIFPQLGSSRIGLTFEVTVTDPVPTNLNAAFIDESKGTWPRP